MSSVYPPYGGGMQVCQRCRAPLSPNEPHCKNCGYYNAPVQGNNPAQGMPSNTFQGGQTPQSAYGQGQPNSVPWHQPPAPYAPNTPMPSLPHAQNIFASPPSQQTGNRNLFGPSITPAPSTNKGAAIPEQTPAQNATLASFTPPQQFGVPAARSIGQPPFGGPLEGRDTQAPFSSPMPTGQQPYPPFRYPGNQQATYVPQAGLSPLYGAPPQAPIARQPSFGAPPGVSAQPGVYPSPNTSQKPDFKEAPRSAMRLIALVVILLVIIVGGSIAGYIFIGHYGTAQVTQTSSVAVSQPKGAPLFSDTFKDNGKGWNLQSYPGKFSVSLDANSMVLEDNNNELLWNLLPGGKTYGDFTLTTDAVLAKGDQNNGYGIYIRGASNQNTDLALYYRFELYGDGSYAAFKGTVDANGNPGSSKLVDYIQQAAIHKQGSSNHITITAKGSSLSFDVNGQHLATAADTSYTNGSIAFFVSNLQNAKPGAQARFSNLNIYAA